MSPTRDVLDTNEMVPRASNADPTYPGFAAPVVVKSHQTGRVAWPRFGLIPSWAKDDKISNHPDGRLRVTENHVNGQISASVHSQIIF